MFVARKPQANRKLPLRLAPSNNCALNFSLLHSELPLKELTASRQVQAAAILAVVAGVVVAQEDVVVAEFWLYYRGIALMIFHEPYQRFLRTKGIIYYSSLIIILFGFACSAASAADQKSEEKITDDERIKILQFLSSHNEANYRKIETWRGKYHFVDRRPEQIQLAKEKKNPETKKGSKKGRAKKMAPPEKFELRDVIGIHEGTVEFAVDVAADKLWSNYQEDGSKTRFLSLDGKEQITPHYYKPMNEKQILTADRLTKLPSMKFGPLREYPADPHHVRKTGGRVARRNTYREHERTGDYERRLDPRRFYSTNPELVWKGLQRYVRALAGSYGVDVRERVSNVLEIARSGDPGTYEYKVTMRFFSGNPKKDEQGLAKDVVRYAERYQYLPIEQTFYSGEGPIHQHRSWSYQRENGVFIPNEFHYTVYSSGTDKLVLERRLRFVSGVLNEPLSADSFSAEHLGLAKAERLEDKVEKKLYVSDGEKLLPADQYTATVKDTNKHSNKHTNKDKTQRFKLIMFINGMLLLVVTIVLFVRRILRSRRQKANP